MPLCTCLLSTLRAQPELALIQWDVCLCLSLVHRFQCSAVPASSSNQHLHGLADCVKAQARFPRYSSVWGLLPCVLLSENYSDEIVHFSCFPNLQAPLQFFVPVLAFGDFCQQKTAPISAQDCPRLMPIQRPFQALYPSWRVLWHDTPGYHLCSSSAEFPEHFSITFPLLSCLPLDGQELGCPPKLAERPVASSGLWLDAPPEEFSWWPDCGRS